MNVEFLDTASAELIEAINYYNLQSEGLGYELAVEIRAAINRILHHPEAWTLISKRTRRCRTSRFPYALIYQIRKNTILIVAVQNLHRHPDSWRARLKPGKR